MMEILWTVLWPNARNVLPPHITRSLSLSLSLRLLQTHRILQALFLPSTLTHTHTEPPPPPNQGTKDTVSTKRYTPALPGPVSSLTVRQEAENGSRYTSCVFSSLLLTYPSHHSTHSSRPGTLVHCLLHTDLVNTAHWLVFFFKEYETVCNMHMNISNVISL